MRPMLNLEFRYGARDIQLALHSPMQGFDSKRIIAQMITLQCLHYLVLALLTPPMLALLAVNQPSLRFQGGATALSMIMDWREIAGVPVLDGGRAWPWNTYNTTASERDQDYLQRTGLATSPKEEMNGIDKWWEWELYLKTDSLHWTKDHDKDIAWQGKQPGRGGEHEGIHPASLNATQYPPNSLSGPVWWNMFARDSSRGWVIVLVWALTGLADVFLLSILIRRPTHILDHTLTLHLFHFLLTSLYTRNVPTNLFYWLVMLAHAGACVVWAEALSIRRELRTGWTSSMDQTALEEGGEEDEEEEQGAEQSSLMGNRSQIPTMSQQPGHYHRPTTHVLFEEGDEEEEEESKEKRYIGRARPESIEMKRLG